MNLRLIQEFNEQEYDEAMRLHENVEKIRKKFVEDFPIDRLDRISLEEYLVSNKEGFCYRLQYELKDMASMGNARPDVFGIYILMKVALNYQERIRRTLEVILAKPLMR